MSIKIVTWTPSQAKTTLSKRYRNSLDSRRWLEDRWEQVERTIYSGRGGRGLPFTPSLEASFTTALPGPDSSNAELSMDYVFKNVRFIHAQMSANPPSVVMRPTSSDQDDRRKADAADRVVRYAIRHYSLQEQVDRMTLQTLIYGTGVIKFVWDSTKGDIIETDQVSGEVKLEGDISITTPHIWNIYLDPDAETENDIKFVFEEIYLDYEEACARWPGKEDLLKAHLMSGGESDSASPYSTGRRSILKSDKYNVVKLLEYWETGLPTNGYLGRYTIITPDGDEIEPLRPNPHRFVRFGSISKILDLDIPDEVKERRIDRLPQVASLPYAFLTDIDVPARVWGRSVVDYTSNLQNTLNQLDSATLDNIQAHGVARLILPQSAEVSSDSITNTPWDVVKITGSMPPHFMEVPQLMPEMTGLRNNLIQGINDICGVNESMFGQQSRETAGTAMQYATNQGNMVRRRLFNKYVLTVETMYRGLLNLIRKHWTTERTIHVLGKEKALEAVDLKGADIDGGYDIVGEYGVSLSLDPMTRREEILTLQPMFEKAGIPTRVSLKMLKLNELEGMYDLLQLAEDRQREYFEEMIGTGRYVPPGEMEDHENMLAWGLTFRMTSDFKYLAPDLQNLLLQHLKDRAKMAAQEKTGLTSPVPGTGTPGPLPSTPSGPLPVAAGQEPGPTTTTAAPEIANG